MNIKTVLFLTGITAAGMSLPNCSKSAHAIENVTKPILCDTNKVQKLAMKKIEPTVDSLVRILSK
jgi:hypothetical protein